MPDREDCPVCFSAADVTVEAGGTDIHSIECPRCGSYRAFEEAVLCLEQDVERNDSGDRMLGRSGGRVRANASAWIRSEFSRDGVLSRNDVPQLASLREPAVLERAELLMLALEAATEQVGEAIRVDLLEWVAHAWAVNNDELIGTLLLLSERGFIEYSSPRTASGMTGPSMTRIRSKGWEYVDELRRGGASSVQGFVAMWYDDSLEEAFADGFSPAIEQSGYRPFRLDKEHYTGKIDNEMVAQIRRSRFLVADLTGKNANVYWEAGFAEALGRKVFLTCHADYWDDRAFDIEHDVCIKWETAEELRVKLQNKVVAVLGQGPLEPVDEEQGEN